MTKYMMMLAAAVSLSACMGDTKVSATAPLNADGSMTCAGSIHMQGATGMPVRCGPQAQAPYSYR